MKEPIAETKFNIKSPTGDSKTIHVEIGRPYPISSVEAACPVAMTGLYPNISDLHGTDTLQALALALEFVRLTIHDWEKKGFTFEFSQGGQLPAEIWFEEKKE